MRQSSKSKIFVGMDVHKDSIEIVLSEAGGEVRRFGRIGGDVVALSKAVRKLESHGRPLMFVYEAGPCGFGIYRWLRSRGHECAVVAPSMTPRRSSDRVKTDARDAEKLARLGRAGELTAVYVPDEADESMRDLVRAREDAVLMQRAARQRLQALLLRQGVRYAARTAWTPAHRRWIARLRLAHPAQRELPSRSTCRRSKRARTASAATVAPSKRSWSAGAGSRWWRRCRRCAASSAFTPRGSWPSSAI
jgi:transposase